MCSDYLGAYRMVGNIFADLAELEKKCPGCGGKLEYGTTTEYSDEKEAHVCLSCGHVFE